MAPRPAAPLYLAREPYKRRRLIDAHRLLPIGVFLLFLVPLVWGGGETDAAIGLGVRSYVHVFVVWGGAIALAAFISRALMRADLAGEAQATEGPSPATMTSSTEPTASASQVGPAETSL